MTSVPAAAAAVWRTAHRDVDLPAGCLVLVGDRPEVCLETLADTDLAAATALGAWWSATRDLWAAAAADRLAGHTWVRTRRTLVEVAQSTAKKDKRDLVEQFAALTETGPAGRLVVEATAATPDAAAVRARARALGGSYTVHEGGAAATLRFPLAGTLWWPNAVGGPAWPGEVAREVVLGLRYAAWRDRRVRRVATVTVTVEEMWADPTAVATPAPAAAPGGSDPGAVPLPGLTAGR